MDFFQRGNEQVCDLADLAEGEAGDRTGTLVQRQRFAVPVSGDVSLG